MKLSAPQFKKLVSLSHGDELCPGGYPEAGRDASNWYRTVDSLVCCGFAVRNRQHASITEAGRDHVRSVLSWNNGNV